MSVLEFVSLIPRDDRDPQHDSINEVCYDQEGRPLSGICGDFMQWELVDRSTLLVFGDGEMDDFSPDNPPPWCRHELSTIIIEEGVQTIGRDAFSANITAIRGVELYIPASLKKVGAFAFSGTFVDVINFPDTVDVDPSALMME